jgi:hypothetical protein
MLLVVSRRMATTFRRWVFIVPLAACYSTPKDRTRLHHASRRIMVTLFFIAIIYVNKSYQLLFNLTSAGKQQQQQQHQQHAASMIMEERRRSMVDCQRQGRLSLLSLPLRINMTLRRGHLTQNLYNKVFTCRKNNKKRHMHPSMKNTPGVLDFTTFLSTDLKILIMGDSVAIQISQTLEEILGGIPENR